MQYGVHTKNEDGTIGGQLTEELFPTDEAAKMWLVKAAQRKEIELKVGGYSVEPYDDEGFRVELVPADEVRKAKEQAAELVASKPDVRKALGTMVSARQMYAVAVREMERTLDAMEPEPHNAVIDVLMQSASEEAQKPFDETVLFQGLMQTSIPWLEKVVKEHVRQDEVDAKREAAEYELQRTSAPVPIGMSVESNGPTEWVRDVPIVLAGHRVAVRILLDHIATTVLAARSEQHPNSVFTVLRFTDKAKREDAHAQLVRITQAQWRGCCATNNSLPKMMGEHVAPMLSALPDVFICDDMLAASPGVHGVSARASGRAANSLKHLGRWAKEVGAGFIGGIPLVGDEPPTVVGVPAYERIRTHATLRPVSVVREADDLDEGMCRILVGRDAFSMDVDEEMLRGDSSIILPGA
jgi:hypothetical protein